MESIVGNAGADTVALGNSVSGGQVDLAGGTDILTLFDAPNNLTITNVETIIGDSGADTVTLSTNVASLTPTWAQALTRWYSPMQATTP